MKTLSLWLGLLLLAGGTAWATNYYVVADGQSTPTPPWTNWGWAHTNLIEVVLRARDNDTVYVTNDATYYLTNEVSISYGITLRSWAPDGSLDPNTTILNGNYPDTLNRCLYINNYGAWLKGLTITNGCITNVPVTYDGGGGVKLDRGHMTNCVITGNRYKGTDDGSIAGGGGLCLNNYSGSVWNCTIRNNTSIVSGGGIYMLNGKVQNCVIFSNEASGDNAGGIYFPRYGAGMGYSNNCIENTIVWANRSGGAGVYSNCYIQESLSLVWPTNSCIAQQGLGTTYSPVNCISNDPKFVDAASTNVRLRADSPCINTGTNREWMSGAVDLDGRRRIDHFSGIVDMGAYEHLSQGSLFTSH